MEKQHCDLCDMDLLPKNMASHKLSRKHRDKAELVECELCKLKMRPSNMAKHHKTKGHNFFRLKAFEEAKLKKEQEEEQFIVRFD